MRFVGASPVGSTGPGVDLRSYWMGLTGCEWVESRKGKIKFALKREGLPHTHHAGDDAAELAQAFNAVLKRQPCCGVPRQPAVSMWRSVGNMHVPNCEDMQHPSLIK
ncbi:hypothetical protein ACO0LG_17085 [Undibacterium sp. Ji42W]|uniref:hypothetical protein n=1 Tax=Undibacterium sp. Ji42W TaxID=3413039 RepID=UPI003BF08F37